VMRNHSSVQRCTHHERTCVVGLCFKHYAHCDSTNDAKSMLTKH